MALIETIRQHTLLVACSVMLLLVGVAGSALLVGQARVQAQHEAARYGQVLADGGAARAVEPALTQDNISMQVILRSLARQPDVVGATIHDVENRLVVQSGQASEDTQQALLRFTAPIAMNDHIAGYLTVSLMPGTSAIATGQFLGLWWALVLLAIIALWLLVYYQQRPARVLEKGEDDESAEEVMETEVAIQFQFLNTQVLRQQLSQELFAKRLAQLDKQLSGILTLYDGRRESFDNNTLTLIVRGDSPTDAAFYALCVCQLMLMLNHDSDRPRLHLAARVGPPAEAADTSLAQALTRPPPVSVASAIAIDNDLVDDALRRRADIDDGLLLQGIKPPYSDLLQRQLQQLSNL
ncbi:MAG TPA: hypothetical protein VIC08_11530 [Cellvibrionaceae bacterium]